MPDAGSAGLVGNGTPFDATGNVECATKPGGAMRTCPFGVVRDGPGNAGVWIALGAGAERQILFEGGVPVTTDAGVALSYEKSGDWFTVAIGDERYTCPEALANGG